MSLSLSHKRLLPIVFVKLPPLALCLFVAERFFKFGSFTLEALAFLGLWYGVRELYTSALRILSRRVPFVPSPDDILQ